MSLNIWGRIESTTSYISTGCLRINHTVGDTNYNVAFEYNVPGVYATVEAKYNNYCIVYVRTFGGAYASEPLTFWMVRQAN